MKIRLVVLAMTLAALTPIYSQAQSMETDNPWMLRVRAVDLLWQNGQSNVVQADNVKATNQVQSLIFRISSQRIFLLS